MFSGVEERSSKVSFMNSVTTCMPHTKCVVPSHVLEVTPILSGRNFADVTGWTSYPIQWTFGFRSKASPTEIFPSPRSPEPFTALYSSALSLAVEKAACESIYSLH